MRPPPRRRADGGGARPAVAAPDPRAVQDDVERALAEDVGNGDVTADLLPADAHASARVITRETAVIAGSAWFDACFRALEPGVTIDWRCADGAHVAANDVLCTLRGNARALVGAERCALNFLQTLSGTATVTAQYVAAVHGTKAVILDTRKTIPGLRLAQKYALRCGGGSNHRIGLFDAILIKENHIAAAGSLSRAVRSARARHPQLLLEVEVGTSTITQALTGADASCSRVFPRRCPSRGCGNNRPRAARYPAAWASTACVHWRRRRLHRRGAHETRARD